VSTEPTEVPWPAPQPRKNTSDCTVTYSNGHVLEGFGNLLLSRGKVTFEPEKVISGTGY
jgi:hypothetical protein